MGEVTRLGLSPAYALRGDTAKARTKYQEFLVLWKDADIHMLNEAKIVYAKLKQQDYSPEVPFWEVYRGQSDFPLLVWSNFPQRRFWTAR